jgi:hypothetical protein
MQAAQTCAPANATARMTKHCPADLQRKQERRAARLALYEQVKRLQTQGVAAIQIARQLQLARGTALKYLRAASFPEMAARPRPRQIDPYLDYLRKRWDAGEHNAQALWREIRAQGYSASDEQVRRVVNLWRADPHHPGSQCATAAGVAKAEVATYSAHKTRWLLWKPLTDLSDAEARYVTALQQHCPEIAQRLPRRKPFCCDSVPSCKNRIALVSTHGWSGVSSRLSPRSLALPRDYVATMPPSKPFVVPGGVKDPSKARSIASKLSSVRCMDEPVSRSCAAVSFTRQSFLVRTNQPAPNVRKTQV